MLQGKRLNVERLLRVIGARGDATLMPPATIKLDLRARPFRRPVMRPAPAAEPARHKSPRAPEPDRRLQLVDGQGDGGRSDGRVLERRDPEAAEGRPERSRRGVCEGARAAVGTGSKIEGAMKKILYRRRRGGRSRVTVGLRAEILEQILVKVNGEIITKTDLEQLQIAALREMPTALDPSKMTDAALAKMLAEVTPEVIVDAIDELLLLQRAKELGMSVTDEQFNNVLDSIKKDNKMETEEQFQAALKQEGMTLAQLGRCSRSGC